MSARTNQPTNNTNTADVPSAPPETHQRAGGKAHDDQAQELAHKQSNNMTTMQTKDLTGAALDWAVAKAVGYIDDSTSWLHKATLQQVAQGGYHPSADDAYGGPLIDQFNITTIRADDEYETDAEGFATEVRIPQWFAQTDQWTGHSTRTSYEGEYMEPTFMIAEDGGYYGITRLIAGMRAFVAFKLGLTVEIPQE